MSGLKREEFIKRMCEEEWGDYFGSFPQSVSVETKGSTHHVAIGHGGEIVEFTVRDAPFADMLIEFGRAMVAWDALEEETKE